MSYQSKLEKQKRDLNFLKSLSETDKIYFCAIKELNDYGEFFPDNEMIMELTKLKIESLGNCIRRLNRRKIIKKIQINRKRMLRFNKRYNKRYFLLRREELKNKKTIYKFKYNEYLDKKRKERANVKL